VEFYARIRKGKIRVPPYKFEDGELVKVTLEKLKKEKRWKTNDKRFFGPIARGY
jgi:hypothetical protein